VICAYVPLHYGLPYLKEAIESVIADVDRLIIIYSATGSHGTKTDAQPPDRYSDLYRMAKQAAGKKLEWYSHHGFDAEWQQRMRVMEYVTDADFLVPLDADEIWTPGLLPRSIELASQQPNVKTWRLPIVHYWRSFRRVCTSPDLPDRLINLKAATAHSSTIPGEFGFIHHMGYAQPTRYIDYKWQIHGHKHEYRSDVNWFEERWLANAQADVHPVSRNHWNTANIELSSLPLQLRNHPYAGMEIIE